MNVLYSLQHVGYTIPPQADAGWIGAVGPGPGYLDEGSGGPENDFTNRNTTFMTWNLLHYARMLKDAGGIPAYGNHRMNGKPARASILKTRNTADRPVSGCRAEIGWLPVRRRLAAPPMRKESTYSLHFQRIAHLGACGKTPVVPQNRRPRPRTSDRR